MEIIELINLKRKNILKPYKNKCKYIIIFIIILIFFLSFFINIYFYIYVSKSNIKSQKLFEKIENKLNETNNQQEQIVKTNSTNIEYSIKLLKMMTNNDEIEYKGALNCLLNDNEFCIYRLLCPKEIPGKKRILIGRKADGGYVLLDDFENIKIAYSFGIDADIYFDKDLADRGIDVYMYDHTINSLPYENPKFHWKKIGVGGKNDKNENIKTLEELIIENGHSSEKNMILKMDIESFEWNTLKDLPDDILNQFKYITIEFHFNKDPNIYYEVLRKLYKTHQVFYFYCNNGNYVVTFGDNRICLLLEVSWVIRKDNTFVKDSAIYPIEDFKRTNTTYSEINLNIFKLFDF